LSARHNQLLWFCSNGQPVEMSQLAQAGRPGYGEGKLAEPRRGGTLGLAAAGFVPRLRRCFLFSLPFPQLHHPPRARPARGRRFRRWANLAPRLRRCPWSLHSILNRIEFLVRRSRRFRRFSDHPITRSPDHQILWFFPQARLCHNKTGCPRLPDLSRIPPTSSLSR
jgi:hypothetical protein